MSTKDFTANVISATKVVPDGNFKDSKASGIWDINEALDLIKGGNWPNAANINPAAFVDALFQTHLYNGNEGTQTITNNVDLTKGGLVWLKRRDSTQDHGLFDTERGVGKYVQSNGTDAEASQSTSLTSFNSNGFTLGSFNLFNDASTRTYCSWTFRKQPKFFDIVTYTGNATNRTISHSLGSVPGMILIKDLSGTGAWAVYHRSVGNGAGQNYVLNLSTTAGDASGVWNGTSPTSSVFTVGTDGTVNESGRNFVAYLFAHNNNDGGFGEPGDQDIIKCGHFETNNSEEATIDLGFEPQWVFYKRYNSSTEGDWLIYDNMRGMQGDFLSQAALLEANTSDAEDATTNRIAVTSTGFKVDNWGTSSVPFIYVAIRRGGMQTPTAASSVFNVTKTADNASTTAAFDIGFVSDFVIHRETDATAVPYVFTRLLGGQHYLRTSGNNAEADSTVALGYDWTLQNSVENNVDGGDPHIFYNWKRARGYFDVVAYSGTGSGAQNVSHNLGVVPEMMWIKVRSDTDNWTVYHSALGNTKRLLLNSSDAVSSANENYFNNTTPTSSVFTGGVSANASHTYIAYLFATVAGVSKVGSYTGNASSQNIDCGFSSGARFVLIKNTTTNAVWTIFDSVRGINGSGTNDPYLMLNLTTGEINSYDLIDPHSSGFTLKGANTWTNTNNDTFIFYAIA